VIYFIQSVDGGPIKIGSTDNLRERLKALEVHYGRPLALLATMPGDREREAEIHAQFSHLRFGRTEQFRPASDLMDFINRPLLVYPSPNTVEAMNGNDTRKPMVVQMRGSEEWKAWIEGLAEKEGFTVAMLLERTARKWAKEIGYPDPPKR
jgi:hypothetical protein